MRALATVFFLNLFLVVCTYAQTNDDNIVIDNKTETYTYKNISDTRIVVEERSSTDYRCLKWPETISVVEFYDNYSEIKSASGKAARKITPNYQMYQQEGIFYSDSKVCYFNIPFTKKEETATVHFEKVYNDVNMFSRIFLFDPQYVRQKTVNIVVPSWMEVDIIEQNITDNIEKNITSDPKTGAVTHSYIIKDQEAAKWESDAPGYHKTAPYLILVPRKAALKRGNLSFFNDYDDVYKWCKDKVDMFANDVDAVATFTKQIVADCDTDEDKLVQIFSWVQNNIRYLAFQYGLAGWVPDNAQDVLRKKYGDCKGMSNLLKTMLRSEGFDARFVWIGTNDIYSDPSIPLPMFNHMICALFRDGAITYLDPTVRYMVAGEYHEAIQGRPTMIEDGENYILGQVPEMPVSQNTDSLRCQYKIDGNILTGNVSMTLSGESKQAILSQIQALESSRRLNILKQFLEKGRPQDKVSDISIDGVDSWSNTLHINYKEVRNGSVNKAENDIYIDMDAWQDFAFATIDTTKRKTDIELSYREVTVREEYLEVPEGYEVVSLPIDIHIENDNCVMDMTYQLTDGEIRYRKSITVKDIWLKRENFEKWNNDINRLKKSYQEQIILRKNEI